MWLISLYILIVIVFIIGLYYLVVHTKPFGVSGTHPWMRPRNSSSHYRNGAFRNIEHTPQLSKDTNMLQVIWRFLFSKSIDKRPQTPFNFPFTNLFEIPVEQDVYVWLGHSSYYIQLDGKRILVDPVLSGYAAPFSFSTKAFEGSNVYSVAHIPPIDLLIITHDHWDHLDYKTIKALQSRVGQVITGLGTDAHLYHWGYLKDQVIAMDWYEDINIFNNWNIASTPARHFSGRSFKRDQCLWSSFVISTSKRQLFIGGDSGYGKHFADIRERYGPMDIAILELGQYHSDWPYIHMQPAEHLQALQDLDARIGIPVHHSKFALSSHPWYAPLATLTSLKNNDSIEIWTPQIGELLDFTIPGSMNNWWEAYLSNK